MCGKKCIIPSGVMSSVTRILLSRASSSGVMRPSGDVGSNGADAKAGGSIAEDSRGGKGERKNGGGGRVEGGEGGGAVVKTPARTELRKNSSDCGGPILRKKNGRSVRATN